MIVQVAGQLGLTVLHDHNYAIPEENVSVSVLTGIGWVAETHIQRQVAPARLPALLLGDGDTYIEIVYGEGKKYFVLGRIKVS